MESLEEEAEAGPGFEAPAGCRGGGYPQTSPRSPPRPPPAASAGRGVAREGGESRGTGSGRSTQRETVRVAPAPGEAPGARPKEAASADRAAVAGTAAPVPLGGQTQWSWRSSSRG